MPKKIKGWSNIKADRPAQNAVWLQDCGWVAGCDAREIQVGWTMLYNGFGKGEVLAVHPVGTASVEIQTLENGQIYTSLRRGLVPCQDLREEKRDAAQS